MSFLLSPIPQTPDKTTSRTPQAMIELFATLGWLLRPWKPEDGIGSPAVEWVVGSPEGVDGRYAEVGFYSFDAVTHEWENVAKRTLERRHREELLQTYFQEADEEGRAQLRQWCSGGADLPPKAWARFNEYVTPDHWEEAAIRLRPKRFFLLDWEQFCIELRRDLTNYIQTFTAA